MLRVSGLLFVVLLPSALGSGAGDAPVIDRVEEDWQLVIRSTDVTAAGPQITTTMCPGPQEDHPDVNFNLNYRDRPKFSPGGLEIEVFDGTTCLAQAEVGSEVLQTSDETITWTQKLSIAGGSVTYQVQNGHSQTWGDFGGDNLTVTFASALPDLSAYKAGTTLDKSGVGWQSDHVTSMQLLRVRYYSGDTLVSTDDTARTVHPSASP